MELYADTEVCVDQCNQRAFDMDHGLKLAQLHHVRTIGNTPAAGDVVAQTKTQLQRMVDAKVAMHVAAQEYAKDATQVKSNVEYIRSSAGQADMASVIASVHIMLQRTIEGVTRCIRENTPLNPQCQAEVCVYVEWSTDDTWSELLDKELLEIATAQIYMLEYSDLKWVPVKYSKDDAISLYRTLFLRNQYQHAQLMILLKQTHAKLFARVCTMLALT